MQLTSSARAGGVSLLRSQAAAEPEVAQAELRQWRQKPQRFRVIEMFAKKKKDFFPPPNNPCLTWRISLTLEFLGLVYFSDLPRSAASYLQVHFALM